MGGNEAGAHDACAYPKLKGDEVKIFNNRDFVANDLLLGLGPGVVLCAAPSVLFYFLWRGKGEVLFCGIRQITLSKKRVHNGDC